MDRISITRYFCHRRAARRQSVGNLVTACGQMNDRLRRAPIRIAGRGTEESGIRQARKNLKIGGVKASIYRSRSVVRAKQAAQGEYDAPLRPP
jgi:hypothetical protein